MEPMGATLNLKIVLHQFNTPLHQTTMAFALGIVAIIAAGASKTYGKSLTRVWDRVSV